MEEKTCKYCKKSVDIKAVKCPYCQEWLNKTTLSLKNPFLIPVLIILLGFGSMEIFERRIKKSTKLNETIHYKNTHKLFLQNIVLKKSKGAPRIIGEIENKESFTWTSVAILAVYSDKQDKPIYLGSGYVKDLRPGEKRNFQVNGPCANEDVSFKDYDHYTIKIETAESYAWSK
jgi:hypothetical protein